MDPVAIHAPLTAVDGQPSESHAGNRPANPVAESRATLTGLRPARYVLLPLAHLLTGYTVKAMERKIERGDWQEGKVWRRAPDGRITIDMDGYRRWVEGR